MNNTSKDAIKVISIMVLSLCSTAQAADLNWSGFATVAATTMNESDSTYVGHIVDGFSFDDTRLGLNVSVDLQNDFYLAGQILMAGTENNYDAHADWLFARYTATPNLSVLFGKMKYPNLLYSEVYDVGFLYPWARVPQETYLLRSNTGSNALYESIQGGSLLYSRAVGEGDAEIGLQAYTGSGGMEIGKVNEMFGLVASMSDEWYQVKLGYNTGELDPGAGGHGARRRKDSNWQNFTT